MSMTTLDTPTYKPLVIDIPENKSLQKVVHSVAPLVDDDEELFPIENFNGLEPGQLDTSILEGSYFDERLQMTLPLYACSSIFNQRGDCELNINYNVKLLGDMRGDQSFYSSVDKQAKKLADRLPQKSIKDEEYIEFLERNNDLNKRDQTRPGDIKHSELAILVFGFLAGSGSFAGLIDGVAGESILLQSALVAGVIAGIAAIWFAMSRATSRAYSSPRVIEKHFNTTLTCPFPGRIPQRIKEIIKTARKDYEDIHMLWDAQDKWVIGKHSSTVKDVPVAGIDYDPIIFGEKNGKFYYLACFDVTPRESTILGEFIG